MQEHLSFTDIIGIAGFIWSLISFYIGYLWYKDGGRKDALIAKLTTDNELLRQELKVIGSADGGVKREIVAYQRTVDRQGLDRLNLFYRAAYKFSRSPQDAQAIYHIICIAVCAIVFALLLRGSDSSAGGVLGIVILIGPVIFLPVMLVLLPVSVLVFSIVRGTRLKLIRRLFDQSGFSFQDVLAAKSWLDQQEWDNAKGQRQLGQMIKEHLSHLERLGEARIGEAEAASAAI